MSTSGSSLRRLATYLLKASVGIGLLGVAIWFNREQIDEVRQRRPDLSLFTFGFLLYLAGALLAYIRWFILVRTLGLPLRFWVAMQLGFIGTLFNIVIPGAVGGDVIKATYLLKLQSKKTQSAACIAIDRIIGLLGLFILGSIAGVVGWNNLEPEVRWLVGIVGFFTVATAGVLVVAFTPMIYRPIARRLSSRPKLAHSLQEFAEMGAAYRRRLPIVLGTLLMATLTHVLNVYGFYLLGKAMFPDVPGMDQHLLIVPLVLFSTAIPLPFGALGVAENVSDLLFRLANYEGGALAMMAFHVCQYIGSFLSLFVYLTYTRRGVQSEPGSESVQAEPVRSREGERLPQP